MIHTSKMNNNDKNGVPRSIYKQRSIQNFPDYLKYVARKSKAGFDKVHEELHRFYWSSSDKVSIPPDQEQQYMPPIAPDTETTSNSSKVGIRKTLSDILWSTTDTAVPVGESFTSYIPEVDDFDSSTSSIATSSEYDIVLSDELEQASSRNCVTHKAVPHSASAIEKHKTRFDFDNFRYVMPYSEHIKEAIYINDRVVKVESHIKEELIHDYDSPSSIYSLPKCKRQKSYEIDDYINLPSPYAEPEEENNDYVPTDTKCTRPCEANVTVGSDKTTASKILTSSKAVADVCYDHYYLPTTEWTQSKHTSPKEQNSTLSIMRKQPVHKDTLSGKAINQHYDRGNFKNGANDSGNSVAVDDGDYYSHPSEWLRPDFKNMPKVHNTTGLFPRIAHTKNIENTNSPTKTGNLAKMTNLLTNDLYTNINTNTKANSCDDTGYCVPNNQWTKSANKQDNVGMNPYGKFEKVVASKKGGYIKSELGIPQLNKSEKLNADKKDSGLRGEDEFYKYTVDEVVECLNECALIELATLCKTEQIHGNYFRGLTADDLKNKPFLMNVFYISKLQKVINGWRPKLYKK